MPYEGTWARWQYIPFFDSNSIRRPIRGRDRCRGGRAGLARVPDQTPLHVVARTLKVRLHLVELLKPPNNLAPLVVLHLFRETPLQLPAHHQGRKLKNTWPLMVSSQLW